MLRFTGLEVNNSVFILTNEKRQTQILKLGSNENDHLVLDSLKKILFEENEKKIIEGYGFRWKIATNFCWKPILALNSFSQYTWVLLAYALADAILLVYPGSGHVLTCIISSTIFFWCTKKTIRNRRTTIKLFKQTIESVENKHKEKVGWV